jgi:hypothetical protein
MADITRLIIEANPTAVTAMIDRVVALAEVRIKEAAMVTAEAIATEARNRVARRTGLTAQGINIQETHRRDGYVILVDREDKPILPSWLEFGTKYMAAKPFLFVAARLQEDAHDRRMREALQSAIDDGSGGLG